MWFIFALLSALFASVRKTAEKGLTHKLNHFTIGWTVQLSALPVIGIALLAFGELLNPFSLGAGFWWPFIAICLGFYPLSTYLYVNALKHGELSKIMPLQCLGPVFALLLGWLTLREVPSLTATVAIGIVVTGVYVLNMKGRRLHNPLHMFSRDKANLFTLLNILLVALAGVLDKIIVQASEPLFYTFASTVGAVIVLYGLSLLRGVREYHVVRRNVGQLAIAGTLFGLSYGAFNLAIHTGPLAYVAAVRNMSILFGALFGFAYLKEAVTRPKAAGLVLIVAGTAVLAIA